MTPPWNWCKGSGRDWEPAITQQAEPSQPGQTAASPQLGMSLPTPDPTFWFRLIGPMVGFLRWLRSLIGGRQRKLIFVERSLSGWSVGTAGEQTIVTMISQLAVSNPNQRDALIVVRVRVSRGPFPYWRALQDCDFCDIADERVNPITSAGVRIAPRTTATMRVQHPFEVNKAPRPRTRLMSFRIVVTDQFNRTHRKRVRLRTFARLP